VRKSFFPLILLAAVILEGCGRKGVPTRRLVPLSEAQPLMTYQNSSPRFRLHVFMYAPGNLQFRVENLLEGFCLPAAPKVTAPTGRVLQFHFDGENVIEFNVVLPGTLYQDSSPDVIIPWVLEEKGPDAFLRSDGEILVDIGSTEKIKYLVQSVAYRSHNQSR
jgi:hypothetical protein